MRHKRIAALAAAAALVLGGCGARTESIPDRASPAVAAIAQDEARGLYMAPPFLDAVFHEDKAQGDNGVRIDLSAIADGYVAVSAVSDSRLKLQLKHGEDTYTYDLPPDGTPTVFPLSCGDGDYLVRVMENVADNRYTEKYSVGFSARLTDEFQPFLRPSVYVPYSQQSDCVKKAEELTAGAADEIEVVQAIYKFIAANIRYDRRKAETVQSGYLPDPDDTMNTGKGICFDYAALAASMLRSRGIPTKMVFGYVSPKGLYHAWNMFYTESSGWVTVKFETSREGWNRMDMTFVANGSSDKFVGDGSNYADVYYY